jgi:hypothetical protein
LWVRANLLGICESARVDRGAGGGDHAPPLFRRYWWVPRGKTVSIVRTDGFSGESDIRGLTMINLLLTMLGTGR